MKQQLWMALLALQAVGALSAAPSAYAADPCPIKQRILTLDNSEDQNRLYQPCATTAEDPQAAPPIGAMGHPQLVKTQTISKPDGFTSLSGYEPPALGFAEDTTILSGTGTNIHSRQWMANIPDDSARKLKADPKSAASVVSKSMGEVNPQLDGNGTVYIQAGDAQWVREKVSQGTGYLRYTYHNLGKPSTINAKWGSQMELANPRQLKAYYRDVGEETYPVFKGAGNRIALLATSSASLGTTYGNGKVSFGKDANLKGGGVAITPVTQMNLKSGINNKLHNMPQASNVINNKFGSRVFGSGVIGDVKLNNRSVTKQATGTHEFTEFDISR